jgi:hypothetical protein
VPRIKRGLQEPSKPQFPNLLAELTDELRNNHAAGQPRIEEQHFPTTNAVRATVIWDKWADLDDEDRSSLILQAYGQVEGEEFRDRIVLAIGLTMPEAYESGLVPYHIMAAVRNGDPVTMQECEQAMLAQGASLLFDRKGPQLRFATEEEAVACKERLIEALPGSEQVWIVAKEVSRIE